MLQRSVHKQSFANLFRVSKAISAASATTTGPALPCAFASVVEVMRIGMIAKTFTGSGLTAHLDIRYKQTRNAAWDTVATTTSVYEAPTASDLTAAGISEIKNADGSPLAVILPTLTQYAPWGGSTPIAPPNLEPNGYYSNVVLGLEISGTTPSFTGEVWMWVRLLGTRELR